MDAKDYVLANCPCNECVVESRSIDEDGDIACTSYRKCNRYKLWFAGKWRALKTMILVGEYERRHVGK